MLPLALSGSLISPSCTTTGGGGPVTSGPATSFNPTGTGPFDHRGNYVEAWADAPQKWPRRSVAPAPSLEIPTADPSPALVQLPPPVASDPAGNPAASTPAPTTPTPPPVAAVTTPKPKPAAAKPASKPKPKPTVTRYTVKKGDTLYELSKRYGTPVAAIQKANGLKGSNIQIGQKLVIPRY
jgi:nucleoid-associated protein YgaU